MLPLTLRICTPPISLTPIAAWCLTLTLGCLAGTNLSAGIVPNKDSPQSDNGTNDPYYLNDGKSFSYVYVFDDDTLVMNGGTVCSLRRRTDFNELQSAYSISRTQSSTED